MAPQSTLVAEKLASSVLETLDQIGRVKMASFRCNYAFVYCSPSTCGPLCSYKFVSSNYTQTFCLRYKAHKESSLCKVFCTLVLSDVVDTTTQCNLDINESTAHKCPDLDTLDKLIQGFSGAKTAANTAFDDLSEKIIRNSPLKD